ncbi:hypothetical protein PsAD2_02966 [Pseudovibrio axinellae]|uniref:Uncharacterized protein n=1 Tax=Pseudovibrio axinellae TaxID=989403 RepID=A0A165XEG1_9HYPH|nr:DUF968 domain-containing protein [Pseudovibrio axinellae]KZL17630.1 hypothetical protein PsAD2_02966 [Pseudovibrio axinellae]SER45682.1 Protein of unknown function [Pseudovibrio axinellae]
MSSRILRPSTAFTLDPSGKEKKRKKDEGHLAFVRKLPCLITGRYGVDPCHIRYGDPLYNKSRTGKATKPDDCWVVPMIREKHDEQHSQNEHLFWKTQGIDPLAVARDLYAISGDEEAAQRIIAAARVRKRI